MEFTYVVFKVTCRVVKLPVAEFMYVVFTNLELPLLAYTYVVFTFSGIHVRCLRMLYLLACQPDGS